MSDVKRPACYAPWTHLNVDAGGDMRPCCICRLKIKVNSLEEGWNSPEMKALRVRMLNGEIPPEFCEHCIDPKRTHVYLSTFELEAKGKTQEVLDKTTPDGETTFTPVSLDIRTHLCNLKCRTCSNYASSALRTEQKKFNVPIQVYHETALSNLKINDLTVAGQTFVEDVKKWYWAGGEPFMSPLHWEVLDHYIKTNNTNKFMYYSTNATFPGKLLDKAIDRLKHFNNVEMVISIDGDGEYGNYVRAGSDMDQVWENIHKIHRELPHVRLGVDTTITNCGILSLADMLERCKELDLKWTGHLLNCWPNNRYLSEKLLRKDIFDHCLSEAIKITSNPDWMKSLLFIQKSYSSKTFSPEDRFELTRYEDLRGMKGFYDAKILPFLNQ